MGWLDRAIGRGVKKGVEQAVAEFAKRGKLDAIVLEVLKQPRNKWFWFVKAMQARVMEVDKTLTGKRAWQIAAAAYREYLKDEKIAFGDPRYDWSRSGARDVIQAYEIDHWDAA